MASTTNLGLTVSVPGNTKFSDYRSVQDSNLQKIDEFVNYKIVSFFRKVKFFLR